MLNAVGTIETEPFAVGDTGMISELLDKALRLFEGDRIASRRLVEQAFTLADRSTRPAPLAQGAPGRLAGPADRELRRAEPVAPRSASTRSRPWCR